ncbi:MAG TPA: DNA methyltransferase [Chloroflexia bacterium]|nr:DNA methyltransferase [Chloroflexia bacterium]
MVTKIREESLPGKEARLRLVGKTLVLDKTALLQSLDQLKAADSVANLRRSLYELRHRLINSALTAQPSSEDNSIELHSDYLESELDQIGEAFTLDRARYYIGRLQKGLTRVKTSPVNDINLNRWKEYEDIYTDSLWLVDRRDRSGAHTAEYWGNFIPQIPHQLLKRYTKQGDWVLDTFAGSGTTLLESQRLGRNAIGIELQPRMVERASQLIAAELNETGAIQQIITGDSATVDYGPILAAHGQKSFQLVVMHPPYFDIIKFSEESADLSNAPTVEAFLEMMGRIVDNASQYLDKGRYLALVIGDKFCKGEWIPLGFLTMNEIQKRNFLLKSIIVKNFEETTGKRNQKELWKYRALVGGFYIFKHEYIFVFKKR